MIRVVHVINSLRLGGAERFVYDLVTHLDPSRFRQHILCLYRAGELAEPLKALGVPVQVLQLGRKIRPRGWFKMWQALRPLNPHILHTHLPEACWYGLLAGWLAGVPIRIAHLQNCHWYWPMKLRLLDRAASIFSTKSVACSEAVQRFYQNELSYRAAKLEVLYNSVDLKRFEALPDRSEARRLLGFPQDALIVVCVASLDEQKGHRYLIEAMLKVRVVIPDTQLLLVGDGSLRQKLEQDAKAKQLTSTVWFLGQRTDIPLILAASDLFALPSLWEGLPLVLTEAAASGLPSVASHIDGIPEVINDGVTGLLVPAANSELLAEAILTLLRDRPRRLEMGQNARQLMRDQFSINKVAEHVESLYLSLLSKRSAAPVEIFDDKKKHESQSTKL